MIIAYFIGCLVVLGVHHWASMQRIKRLGYSGQVHGQNMYRLGVADGKIWAYRYLMKSYESLTPPKEETHGSIKQNGHGKYTVN